MAAPSSLNGERFAAKSRPVRTLPKYDDSNIIAQINDGTVFEVTDDKTSSDYIWAKYSGMTGWVNKNYTVKV